VALPGRAVDGDSPELHPADGLPPARPADGQPQAPASRASLDGLRDPDPEIRASVAEWISLDPGTFPELADLLRHDPSAGVRVAAATTLGDAMNKPEEREAVALLLEALHDDEPEVVLAALGALEFVGDAGTAPGLDFLLEHPTAEVRNAAANTIEWLED
jgi:HEAT repeat protein